MADEVRAGWANPGNDPQRHYFESKDGKIYSACRKYVWWGFVPFALGDDGNSDNCAVCTRKLATRAKEAK